MLPDRFYYLDEEPTSDHRNHWSNKARMHTVQMAKYMAVNENSSWLK